MKIVLALSGLCCTVLAQSSFPASGDLPGETYASLDMVKFGEFQVYQFPSYRNLPASQSTRNMKPFVFAVGDVGNVRFGEEVGVPRAQSEFVLSYLQTPARRDAKTVSELPAHRAHAELLARGR
jgi:hypothetical protein